ncbi:LysR substrate-binding domain-containing protein [Enterovirga sp. CN4-39]|uniref:LysR substrate-binding domain-containing protein n=1 Tax=Enterovirga sp. CN4-39 TaxID=3400910 RepID=UPI003C0A3FB1
MESNFKNLPLNPLRAFAIASRHRTFTAAAKHMGITQVAISRQIAVLENYLGVQLFERRSRSIVLTDVGRRFGQEVAGLFDDIEHATRALLSDETDTIINFRTYPTVARHWLMPRIGGFLSAYPDYRLRLDTTVEPLDFRGTQLDVALQLGSGTWRDARSVHLLDEAVDVVCSPSYARLLGDPADFRRLNDATILQAKYRRHEWEVWSKHAGVDLAFRNMMGFDSSLLTYSAAMNGLGLAIGQLALLSDELASGHLVRPFSLEVTTGMAFHVVWPTTKSVSVQTRRFIDWLLISWGRGPAYHKRPITV